MCNIFMEQSHEKGPLFRTMTLKGASYQMDHLKGYHVGNLTELA